MQKIVVSLVVLAASSFASLGYGQQPFYIVNKYDGQALTGRGLGHTAICIPLVRGNVAQQWYLHYDPQGHARIRNRASGLFLTLPGRQKYGELAPFRADRSQLWLVKRTFAPGVFAGPNSDHTINWLGRPNPRPLQPTAPGKQTTGVGVFDRLQEPASSSIWVFVLARH